MMRRVTHEAFQNPGRARRESAAHEIPSRAAVMRAIRSGPRYSATTPPRCCRYREGAPAADGRDREAGETRAAVARIERSEIRGRPIRTMQTFPDYACASSGLRFHQ